MIHDRQVRPPRLPRPNNGYAKKPVDAALSRYFIVCGTAAEQPCHQLSTVSRNGTSFLKNAHGLLAVVTARGRVYSHIGGLRLDRWPPDRRA